MKLVIGLGNPGDKYQYTRHNTGFMLVNAFVSKISDGVVWLDETKFKSHIYRTPEVIFAKPQTFMNESGEAIAKIREFYKIDLNDVLIIHDDVDLAFGEFKMKKGSGSAGHNGVADIIEKLGSKDFWRLRVGVGRPESNKFEVYDFVLQKFSDEELKKLEEITEKEIHDIITNFLEI